MAEKQTGSNTVTEVEEKELQQAYEYLAYWRPQLRLSDRDIEIRLASSDEITNGASAQSATRKYNGGIIVIQPNAESIPALKRFFRNDLEVRIVHELLHLKESLWRDNPKLSVMDEDHWISRMHEECLDAIAEALVRARRGITR